MNAQPVERAVRARSLADRVAAAEATLAALEESSLQEDARATLKVADDYIARAETLIAAAALSERLAATHDDPDEAARLIARLTNAN